MAMEIDDSTAGWVSGSCACVGIKKLGSHTGPVEAMQKFCELQLVRPTSRWDSASTPKYRVIESFYAFVAGPEIPGKHWSSKTWVRYGSEFAAFIRKNRLGKVASSGPTLNLKHHSSEGTTCQVWIWMPNRVKLIAWWERNKPKVVPAPVPPPAPTITYQAPTPVKQRESGRWDIASGVADGVYCCPHCKKTYVYGERIWYNCGFDGQYYCEAYGLEQESKAQTKTNYPTTPNPLLAPIAFTFDDIGEDS